MKRRAVTAPKKPAWNAAWVEMVTESTVLRALPETYASDFADQFQTIWRKKLKQFIPRTWPKSFLERLLGNIYIEFLERLRGENVRGALRNEVRSNIEKALVACAPKRDVQKGARAFADARAEELLSPIVEGAAFEAAARMKGEIVGTRELISRIGLLRPKALHRFAAGYNWDDGYVCLFEAIRSPSCALGTAAMVYWRGRPHYFRQYERRNEVPSYCIDNYDLLMEIEKRVRRNAFKHHGVAYDPREDGGDLTRTIYPEIGKKRELPDEMYLATRTDGAVCFAASAKLAVRRTRAGRRRPVASSRAAGQ